MANHKQCQACSFPFLGLLLVIIAITTSIHLLFAQNEKGYQLSSVWTKPCSSKCNADIERPYLQLQKFTYNRYDPSHDDSLSLLSKAGSILANSNGSQFIQLKERNSKAKHYGVSMFHQLHCLESLRAAVRHSTHQHVAEREMDEVGHLDHCFEYLTQAIMCAADDTIEPSFVAETSDGKKVRVIDGDGVVHQCQDFDGMYAAVMKTQIEPFGIERELREGDTVHSTLGLRD